MKIEDAERTLEEHGFERIKNGSAIEWWRPGQHVRVTDDGHGNAECWLKFDPSHVLLDGAQFINIALTGGRKL